MDRVPEVLAEAVDEFAGVFNRRPDAALSPERTDDADIVLIATNTMARTLRRVVQARRQQGQRLGMIKLKMFRPFPRRELLEAIGSAKRIGILDRNHSPGSGGIFGQEVITTLKDRPDVLVQDYIVGIGGGDVTPYVLEGIVDDLAQRTTAVDPIWKEAAA
jgi:pyruvate/2-oxoacid:ferredoxin oxidoreductase alpha subunit